MSDVKVLLEEQIKCNLVDLGEQEVGSEERSKAVDETTRLLDKYNDMCKHESEISMKLMEMENNKVDSIVKNSLTAVSIFGGFALTVWGTFKTFKFEETGTITTMMGRGFINKLLPKK